MKRSSWHLIHPGSIRSDYDTLLNYMEINNITNINDTVVGDILAADMFNGRHNSIPSIDKILSKTENVAILAVYNKDKSSKWWNTYQTMYHKMVKYNFSVTPVDIDVMDSSDIHVISGSSRSSNTPASKQRLYTTNHSFTYTDTWQHNRRVLKAQPVSRIIKSIRLYGKAVGRSFTNNISTILRYLNGGSGYEYGPPAWFQQFASWTTNK